METKKTVYITRNALFKNITMMLCNNIIKADESFFEDNMDLFFYPCETCKDKNETDQRQCEDCAGEGQHESEAYQYFLVSANEWEIERLKEYGVDLGYSELLDLHVLPIFDYGTSWSAFSYSKEVPNDYQLAHDETDTHTTVY